MAHVGVMQQHSLEPANSIIEKFGGVRAVAAILDKDESTIRRWRMPRPMGTGGSIPDDDKVRLIEAAASAGIVLRWRDFAPPTVRKFA